MRTYDLIVIGSGPAGQRAAIQAAKCGRSVAVIELREIVGGVCINTGTIPSKTMREAVLHLSGFQYQGIYGVNYCVKDKITMFDLVFRINQVIKTEAAVTQNQLTRNGVEVIHGRGSFIDATHIRVENVTGQADLAGKFIILATGTKPADSPAVPINGRTIINSDQLLEMKDIPHTLIVVGGGVIGVEYACMFAVLGVRVVLVERRPRLLEFADAEIVEALSYHLREKRVTLRLNEEVASVEESAGGGVAANLKSNKRISGDALLYAVGRQGNVDGLDLAKAGLAVDNRGRVAVDAEFRTTVPNIYAVGDLIGFPSLASVAMEQGRLAAAHAFGLKIESNPATYPYGIYTIPEISFIGKTEEQLTDEDVPYEVGMAYYRETREILGVHIIGEGAAELLHIGQAVMILKGTIDYFVDTVFNYPTLAECYKQAAFNGINRLGHDGQSGGAMPLTP